MTRLADELLEWILSPPLHVPDALFADPGSVSPFSRATYSASDVLLVCKSWMRVATPALYATVVIRSTAQAQALALALSRNPQFGRYVKKLRLEGAYGQYTKEFMPLMTNVTDLCLALSVRGSDNITGLLAGLKTFDPRRVILTLPPVKIYAKYDSLLAKLSKCIERWSCLASLFVNHCVQVVILPQTEFSFTRGNWDHIREYERCGDLVQALSKSASLETVHYPLQYWDLNVLVAGNVRKLLANNTITTIVLHLQTTDLPASHAMQSVPTSTAVRLYISFKNGRPRKLGSILTDQHQLSVRRTDVVSNPFYRPLCDVSRDLRLEIWSRVFSFALKAQDSGVRSWGAYSQQQTSGMCMTGERINKRVAVSLLRVSWEFNTAALRAICGLVHIENPVILQALGEFLSRNESLGSWIRTVSLVYSPGLRCGDIERVFAVATDVRQFTAEAFRPTLFPAVKSLFISSGNTLRRLVLVDGGRLTRQSGLSDIREPYPCDTFKDLVALEDLEWDVEHISFDTAQVADSFPRLRRLTLRRSDPTFVELLAQCSLPQISHISLGRLFVGAAALFARHGNKIQSLVAQLGLLQGELDAFPALRFLELSTDVKPSDVYTLSHEHLRTIKLNWPTCNGSACLGRYRTLGKSLVHGSFPGLSMVVVAEQKEIWPLSEREISRSPWPKIAALFSEHGISLVDYTHRAWRPRLQVR